MSLTVVDSFEIVRAEEADEPFQAGSVSKAVAALVAVRLVDSGALELDGDGWFGHVGGAFGFFSAFFGSTEGGRAIVAWTPGGATPEFFLSILAAADERGWKGLRT